MKILLLITVFGSQLFSSELKMGLYMSQECSVSIQIFKKSEGHYAYATSHKKGSLLFEDNYMEFQNLYGHYYANGNRKLASFIRQGQQATKVTAYTNTSNTFTIQNRGNSLNPYLYFSGCADKLKYSRIRSLSTLEKKMKNEKNLKAYNLNFWKNVLNTFPISIGRVSFYNNIAYYLQRAKQYEEALFILNKILHRTPNRTIAHLNYAQGIDALIKQSYNRKYTNKIAIKHYLTYTAQMLEMNKKEKMNAKIKGRYRGYWNMLNEMNTLVGSRYQILDFTWGDLNADKKPDIAFVVEVSNSDNIEDFSPFVLRPKNHNRRLSFVFLRTRNSYTLVAQNTILLPSDENNNCNDPFSWVSIKNQRLLIETNKKCPRLGYDESITYHFKYLNSLLSLNRMEWRKKKVLQKIWNASSTSEILKFNTLSHNRFP